MKDKYLPIGTIVTRKGQNKKFMIVGYNTTIYNGKITTYDYCAYPYPEGLLLKNQNGYFNHLEIEKIDFMGYEGTEYQSFISKFLTSTDEEQINKNDSFKNIKFDENGIVVFDGIDDKNSINKQEDEIKNIKFDENGFVISIGNNEEVDNPFVTIIKNRQQPVENNDMSIFKDYKFDENGFVVEDTSIKQKAETEQSPYQFDENGFVVDTTEKNSIESIEELDSKTEYKFDENGFIISD